MSNLIPTPRTDRNGRTVIRHMKPEQAVSPALSSIPTVGAMMDRISAKKTIASIIKASSWNLTEEEVLRALNLLQDDSEDILPLIERALTIGSDNSRELMEGFIGAELNNVVRAKAASVFDPTWRTRCAEAWSPHFQAEINRRWHALLVSDEYGYDIYRDDADFYFSLVKGTQHIIGKNYAEENLPREDSYWRGVAASALVQHINDDEVYWTRKTEIALMPRFIEVAGNHPDLKRFLAVAVPRNFYDADAIQAVLNEQERGSATMGSGVL